MSAASTEASVSRARRKRILRIATGVFSVAIVVAIFAYAIPKFASYKSIFATLGELTWPQWLLLVGVTLLNLVSYWPPIVVSMPGLTLGQAAVNNQSSTSIANTVPVGGGAIALGVSYAMYRSWGFSNTAFGLSTLVTGIWNTFLKLAMPIVAVAILALSGASSASLIVPALIGLAILATAVVLFGLVVWKKSLARRIGSALGTAASAVRRLVRKPPVGDWGEAAVRFRRRTNDFVARRWPALTVTTIVSHVSLYLVMLLAVRLVGITPAQVSWAQVLGIFSFGRLLTAAPITPGGAGIAELAYIAGLVLAGGSGVRTEAAAAAILFRLLTYWFQIPIGGITYLIWLRKKSWRKPVTEPPLAGVVAVEQR